MLSRAPHVTEDGHQAGASDAAGVPEWADRTAHPVLAEVVPRGEFVSEDEETAASTPRSEKDVADDLPSLDGTSEPESAPPPPAPTGELTLAALWTPGLSVSRRMVLITATLAINIGLPFINGVFLGFGEIFARAFLAPLVGLAPPLLNYNKYSPSPSDVPPLDSIPAGGLRAWAKGLRQRQKSE